MAGNVSQGNEHVFDIGDKVDGFFSRQEDFSVFLQQFQWVFHSIFERAR